MAALIAVLPLKRKKRCFDPWTDPKLKNFFNTFTSLSPKFYPHIEVVNFLKLGRLVRKTGTHTIQVK